MPLTLVTAPTVEPLTVAEARQHLRVDGNDQDDVIARLVAAARRRCEAFTRRAFVTQTWDLTLDAFPCWTIDLPRPPLQSVTHVKYLDTSGVQQTLSAALYTVDTKSEWARITPAYGQSWPSTRDQVNAVEVRFVAGFGQPSTVPDDIKAAMLLMVGHLYEHREEVADLQTYRVPVAVEALLGHHQVFAF